MFPVTMSADIEEGTQIDKVACAPPPQQDCSRSAIRRSDTKSSDTPEVKENVDDANPSQTENEDDVSDVDGSNAARSSAQIVPLEDSTSGETIVTDASSITSLYDRARADESNAAKILLLALPRSTIWFLQWAGALTVHNGRIQVPRCNTIANPCYILSSLFWSWSIFLMGWATVFVGEAVYFHQSCVFDENCVLQKNEKSHLAEVNTIAEYGVLSVVAFTLEIVGDIIAIFLMHFFVPYIFKPFLSEEKCDLDCKELFDKEEKKGKKCLNCFRAPWKQQFKTLDKEEKKRKKKQFKKLDKCCLCCCSCCTTLFNPWATIVYFTGTCITLSFWFFPQFSKEQFDREAAIVTLYMYFTSVLVSCALFMIFGFVKLLVQSSYDEWEKKLDEAEKLPRDQLEKKEEELLEDLKPRVMLSSTLTMKMKWLFLPTLLYLIASVFALLDVYVDAPADKLLFLLTERYNVLHMKLPPVFFAFMISRQMDNIKAKVSTFGFEKINAYLTDAPAQWMLTSGIALSFNTLSGLTALFALSGLGSLVISINREAMVQPWDTRYERFGTCSDGIRSGLEQHIDCGGPESGCAQTCREKYGEYILIPGDRACTEVDGYEYITTQAACALAYKSWSNMNGRSAGPKTRVYLNQPYFDEPTGVWNDTFSCGAFSMPRIIAPLITGRLNDLPLSMANDKRVAFPAMFSLGHQNVSVNGVIYEKPIAHLCYAGTGCQRGSDSDGGVVAKRGNGDVNRFHEQIPCPGACLDCDHGSESAWEPISAPIRQSKTMLASVWDVLIIKSIDLDSRKDKNKLVVTELRPIRSESHDCMEITVDNSRNFGAQAVFTLACDTGNDSSGTDARPLCPANNRVTVTAEGTDKRSALLVFPTADMTNGQRYGLGQRAQSVEVYPDNTVMLVVDRDSKLKSVELCFDNP